MIKPSTFPQGTQRIARIARIARIDELCEANAYVPEPAPPVVSEQAPATVDGQITDAELASALVGNQVPIEARRTKRITSAYSTEPVVTERPILTIA